MKITRLDDDGGRKVLQAEAEWAGIAADYDDIVSAYSRVQIPGFRPGKVPRSVIEQRLQKEILDDLSHNTAQRLCREALRESDDEAMGPIEIKDIMCAKGKPFRFTARFWPMPEIALPDFGSLVVQEGGSDPRDQISHRLLDLVRFTVPDDVVRAELGDEDTDIRSDGAEWKAASDRSLRECRFQGYATTGKKRPWFMTAKRKPSSAPR